MVGQFCSLGYPPWQAQYLLHDFPRGTLPLRSSLHRAEELRVSTAEFADVKAYYDVSGSQQHSEASRRRESPRCRAIHQCRTALWRFRSSRSSSECRRSRARIFRTASHSAPCFGGDLTRNKHQDKFASERLATRRTRIQPTVCFVFDISWFPTLPLQ